MKERPIIAMMGIDEASAQVARVPSRDWLSPSETDRCGEIDSRTTRSRWLAGRWLGKRAVMQWWERESIRSSSLHIESRDAFDRGAPPRLFRDGRLTSLQLSISHAGDTVAVAVSGASSERLGIDVMDRQPMGHEMSRFWLRGSELYACRSDRWACQFVWSLKEALYKAGVLGTAVPFSPRKVDTSRWIYPATLLEVAAAIRGGKTYTAPMKNGCELQLFQHRQEFVTLVSLSKRPQGPDARLLSNLSSQRIVGQIPVAVRPHSMIHSIEAVAK